MIMEIPLGLHNIAGLVSLKDKTDIKSPYYFNTP